MEISILNVEVSCFKNYFESNNPITINLLDWLNSNKYKNTVEKIRSISDKTERDKIKATLPAITPSGIFSSRNDNNLIKHSGFLQFDIDYKDNRHIGNYNELKTQICKIKNVAYCGMSVSGTGYWGLIPIAYPNKHKQQFEALKADFKSIGINIDCSCSNLSRLRGYSYDNNAYFNHKALVYYNIAIEFNKEQPKHNQIFNSDNFSIQGKVEECLNKILNSKIDITGNYQQWFSLGCSLANEFGEAGRTYYHTISQFYCKYKYEDTNKQFTECLKHSYRYTIATFFEYCKNYDIEYKQYEKVLQQKQSTHNNVIIPKYQPNNNPFRPTNINNLEQTIIEHYLSYRMPYNVNIESEAISLTSGLLNETNITLSPNEYRDIVNKYKLCKN